MARQTGTVGMGRVDVSGLGTMMDPLMKGMALQQQAEGQRQDRYGKSLLATADMLDKQRQYTLQQEANRRANEALGIQKAQEARAVDKALQESNTQKALVNLREQGQYASSGLTNTQGMNLSNTYDTLYTKGLQSGLSEEQAGIQAANIVKQQADTTLAGNVKDPNMAIQYLKEIKQPDFGNVDQKILFDAREKLIAPYERRAETLSNQNFTADQDAKRNALTKQRIDLEQEAFDYKVSQDKADAAVIKDIVGIEPTVPYSETVPKENTAVAQYMKNINTIQSKIDEERNILAATPELTTKNAARIKALDMQREALLNSDYAKAQLEAAKAKDTRRVADPNYNTRIATVFKNTPDTITAAGLKNILDILSKKPELTPEEKYQAKFLQDRGVKADSAEGRELQRKLNEKAVESKYDDKDKFSSNASYLMKATKDILQYGDTEEDSKKLLVATPLLEEAAKKKYPNAISDEAAFKIFIEKDFLPKLGEKTSRGWYDPRVWNPGDTSFEDAVEDVTSRDL